MVRQTLAAAAILLLSGCVAFHYAPEAGRAAYLAAKDSTYCRWRFEAVSLEDMKKVRPALEALHAALSSETEAEFDEGLAALLFAEIDRVAEPADREILKELVAAALEDVQLAVSADAPPSRRQTAVLVVGGILDGIAYAEEAARTAS